MTQEPSSAADSIVRRDIETIQRDLLQQKEESRAEIKTLRDELEAHAVAQDEDEREAIRAGQETVDAFKRIGDALTDTGSKVAAFESRFDKRVDALRDDTDNKLDKVYTAIKDAEQRGENRTANCRRQQDEDVRREVGALICAAVTKASAEVAKTAEEKAGQIVVSQKRTCDDITTARVKLSDSRLDDVEKTVETLKTELFKLAAKVAVISAGVGFGGGLLLKTILEKYFTKGAS